MSQPLLHALIVVLALAFVSGAFVPAAATAALLVNLFVCWKVGEVTGAPLSPFPLAVIDLVTATVILLLPRSRPQIAMAATYVFALICHAIVAAVGHGASVDMAYWWGLYAMAWTQVAIAALWAGHDGWQLYRSRGYPWRGVDFGARVQGVLARVRGRR